MKSDAVFLIADRRELDYGQPFIEEFSIIGLDYVQEPVSGARRSPDIEDTAGRSFAINIAQLGCHNAANKFGFDDGGDHEKHSNCAFVITTTVSAFAPRPAQAEDGQVAARVAGSLLGVIASGRGTCASSEPYWDDYRDVWRRPRVTVCD